MSANWVKLAAALLLDPSNPEKKSRKKSYFSGNVLCKLNYLQKWHLLPNL
jgi:hypothetical protein